MVSLVGLLAVSMGRLDGLRYVDVKGSGLEDKWEVPSPVDGKQGVFLFTNPAFSQEEAKAIADDVAGMKIVKLVRTNTDGTKTCWLPNGNAANLEPEDHYSDSMRDSLSGPVYVLVEYCGAVRSASGKEHEEMLREFVEDRYRNFLAADYSWGYYVRRTWLQMSSRPEPFVDMKFSIDRREEIGTIGKKLGSKAKLDDAEFEVTDVHTNKEESDWNAHYSVTARESKPGRTYLYYPRVDWPAFEKKNGQGAVRYCYCLDAGGSSRADKPIEFWKDIVIVRKTTITGYFGHIPTRPRYNP